MTVFEHRRIGLEQEYFLVDERGILSNRADEFLDECREAAHVAGRDPGCFAPECARSMVEANTPPVHSLAELAREYLTSLELALDAGGELGLRLYPLATYPLRVEPEIHDDLHYQLQARTVGRERFAHAGRCAGVHLHLEAPEAIDPRVGVSHDAPEAAREELLNLYNLATALDFALVTLTRSSPFTKGRSTGLRRAQSSIGATQTSSPRASTPGSNQSGVFYLTPAASRSWSSSSSPVITPGSRRSTGRG